MASRAQTLATLLVTRMHELDDATPDGDAFYDLENYAVEQLVGQILATEADITDESIVREVFEAMPHKRRPAEGEMAEFARFLAERFPRLEGGEEATYTILDRHGGSYRVHSERRTGWSFDLSQGDNAVGYMNCIERPPVLLVGDFKLYDDVRLPESIPAKFWRKLSGLPPPTRSYRNQGIGTAMFDLLSRLAAEAGFDRLEGWISTVDTEGNPDLPAWYRRRGFEVTLESNRYPHQVATITKVLRPQRPA